VTTLTAAVVLATAAAVVLAIAWDRSASEPHCHVTANRTTFDLEVDQTRHATTIAAVGKRMGMPDHAVTIALAAALQESNLHNLDHGDRDSLGLFQQRPSQGWGDPSQLLTPSYAAEQFYRHLAKVDGWADMSVTAAAQHVQRSAAPDAYGKWEPRARALAVATTGEEAAGIACRFDAGDANATPAPLAQELRTELGSPNVDTQVDAARGWTVAVWLVGHATTQHVDEVTFAGRRWTPASGRWERTTGAENVVRVRTARG
jgi:hypothetical protein